MTWIHAMKKTVFLTCLSIWDDSVARWRSSFPRPGLLCDQDLMTRRRMLLLHAADGLHSIKDHTMITIQGSVSKGWLHNEDNFSFQDKYYFDPLFRWNQDRAADLFVANKFPDLPIYNMESNLVQAEYFDSNQILIGGIQPNMLLL